MGFDFKGFDKKILVQLRENVKSAVQRNYKRLRSVIKPIIVDAVYDSPEMISIRSGILRADFGLDFDPSMVIAWTVADSMRVNYSYPTNAVFSFSLSIQLGSYENLLSQSYSVVVTENGESLPWLQWLLLYGDKVINYDFGVFYNKGSGRSELGIMLPGQGLFSVNPMYSGTQRDNFITRAISRNLDKIQQTAWQTLQIR
jgi:hypothetical protein